MKQKISFANLFLYYVLSVCGLLNLYRDYGPVGNQERFDPAVGHAIFLLLGR